MKHDKHAQSYNIRHAGITQTLTQTYDIFTMFLRRCTGGVARTSSEDYLVLTVPRYTLLKWSNNGVLHGSRLHQTVTCWSATS